MLFIEIFLIGISLSMDAFSLALSLGIYYKIINDIKYSIITGIYHFFMPLCGFLLKDSLTHIVYINDKLIFIIVVTLILVGIIFDNHKISNRLMNPLLFGLSVSLDSFMIGITLNMKYLIYACIVFSITSFLFTIIGFKISVHISKKYNEYSKYISAFILLIILIFNLLS